MSLPPVPKNLNSLTSLQLRNFYRSDADIFFWKCLNPPIPKISQFFKYKSSNCNHKTSSMWSVWNPFQNFTEDILTQLASPSSCQLVHSFNICFENFLQLVIALTLLVLFLLVLSFAISVWCRRALQKKRRSQAIT